MPCRVTARQAGLSSCRPVRQPLSVDHTVEPSAVQTATERLEAVVEEPPHVKTQPRSPTSLSRLCPSTAAPHAEVAAAQPLADTQTASHRTKTKTPAPDGTCAAAAALKNSFPVVAEASRAIAEASPSWTIAILLKVSCRITRTSGHRTTPTSRRQLTSMDAVRTEAVGAGVEVREDAVDLGVELHLRLKSSWVWSRGMVEMVC
jgi:hypothetical protein